MPELQEMIEEARQFMIVVKYDDAHKKYLSVADILKGEDNAIKDEFTDEVTKSLKLLEHRKSLLDKLSKTRLEEKRRLEEAEHEEMVTRGGGSENTSAFYVLDSIRSTSANEIAHELRELRDYESQLPDLWKKLQ